MQSLIINYHINSTDNLNNIKNNKTFNQLKFINQNIMIKYYLIGLLIILNI